MDFVCGGFFCLLVSNRLDEEVVLVTLEALDLRKRSLARFWKTMGGFSLCFINYCLSIIYSGFLITVFVLQNVSFHAANEMLITFFFNWWVLLGLKFVVFTTNRVGKQAIVRSKITSGFVVLGCIIDKVSSVWGICWRFSHSLWFSMHEDLDSSAF